MRCFFPSLNVQASSGMSHQPAMFHDTEGYWPPIILTFTINKKVHHSKLSLLFKHIHNTVDGKNPAPPWMVETCWNPINNGINYLSTGAGFLQSTVCIPFLFFFGGVAPARAHRHVAVPGEHVSATSEARSILNTGFDGDLVVFTGFYCGFMGIQWDSMGFSWSLNEGCIF